MQKELFTLIIKTNKKNKEENMKTKYIKKIKKANHVKRTSDWFDTHLQVIGCDDNDKVKSYLKDRLMSDFLDGKFESKKN